MNSDTIHPKSGSYHGHFVVESLGNVAVFFRWDPEHEEASADFCVDGIYRASLRARIENLQLREARLRTVKSPVAIELTHVDLQIFSKTSLQLVCSLPMLPSILCVELNHQANFFRQLEIVCYAPKGQLEGDLALRLLYPAIKKQLAHAGIKALIRTGYPALPKDSPYGYEDLEYWEDRELHELMESRSPAISTPRLWRLILLFVPRYDAGPLIENNVVRVKGNNVKGSMFDRVRGNVAGIWQLAITSAIDPDSQIGLPEDVLSQIRRMSFPQRFPLYNDTVRQGAAIFYRNFQNHGATARTEFLHTILHEIGHIFNLRHDHNEASVMEQAPGAGSISMNFLPHEVKEIRNGFFDDVAPGGFTEFLGSDEDIETFLADDYSIVANSTQPNVRIGELLDVVITLKGKFDRNKLNVRLLLRKQGTKNNMDSFVEFVPSVDSIVYCDEGEHRICLRVQGIDLERLGFTTPGRYGLQAGAAHPNGYHYLFGQLAQEFNLISPQHNPNIFSVPNMGLPREKPKQTGSVCLPLGEVSKVTFREKNKGSVGQITKIKGSSNSITFWTQEDEQIGYSLDMVGMSHQGLVLQGLSDPIILVGKSESRSYQGKFWPNLELIEKDGGGQGTEPVIIVGTGESTG